MQRAATPAWVDIRTTQQVVEVGLRTILERAEAPMAITFEASTPGAQPDVILYDVINLDDGDTTDLEYLLRHTVSTIIAVDRTLKPELGTRAKETGVEWAITLDISPDELVAVIDDALSGNLDDNSNVAQEWSSSDHLGASSGISPRESDILQLVVMGYSNQEIADTLFLSINSVKTYIRSAYRKIGASSRAQAIVWAIQNGFLTTPQPERDETG